MKRGLNAIDVDVKPGIDVLLLLLFGFEVDVDDEGWDFFEGWIGRVWFGCLFYLRIVYLYVYIVIVITVMFKYNSTYYIIHIFNNRYKDKSIKYCKQYDSNNNIHNTLSISINYVHEFAIQ